MTLTQTKKDKKEIEDKISKMLIEYSNKYKVSVNDINLYTNTIRKINSDHETVTSIEVNLEVIIWQENQVKE